MRRSMFLHVPFLLLSSCISSSNQVGEGQFMQAVKALGGGVTLDEKQLGNPVIAVDLRHTNVTDELLAKLQFVPSVKSLDLSKTAITDAVLNHLRSLKSLRRLYLWDTKI